MALTINQVISDFGAGFTKITQLFSSTHKGVDIAAPIGTPIHADVSGTVIYAENASVNIPKAVQFWTNNAANTESMGNAVVIQDTNGVRYFYGHLNSFAVNVGQSVTPSTIIGAVGQTGNATGPHLHFAMANSSSWLDPTTFLMSASGSGNSSSNVLTGYLDKYIGPFVGQGLTWQQVMTKQAQVYGLSEPFNILLGQLKVAFPAVGITANSPLDANSYSAVRNWFAGGSQAYGDITGNIVPDITGVLYFIGIILVGIAFLFLAGFVSKVGKES